jgi:hypothetical protein
VEEFVGGFVVFFDCCCYYFYTKGKGGRRGEFCYWKGFVGVCS